MGYTHYISWGKLPLNLKQKKLQTALNKIGRYVKTVLADKHKSKPLIGPALRKDHYFNELVYGKEFLKAGRPIIWYDDDQLDVRAICFNEIKDEDDCEDFLLFREHVDTKDTVCIKTVHQNYDHVVVGCLTILNEHIPGIVEIDGNSEDWEPGVQALKQIMGVNYQNPFGQPKLSCLDTLSSSANSPKTSEEITDEDLYAPKKKKRKIAETAQQLSTQIKQKELSGYSQHSIFSIAPKLITNEISTTERWLEKFEQKITIVLDIDETLVASYHARYEYEWVQFFKDNGLFFEIKIEEKINGSQVKYHHLCHCIHPAVPTFIKALFSIQNADVVFFSSGDKRRNLPFVEHILRLSLGDATWEKIKSQIKIYSSDDLMHYQNFKIAERMAKSPDSNHFFGNYKKDLLTAVDQSQLDWTVIIDDDSSYIMPDQTKNFLKILSLNCSAYSDFRYADKLEYGISAVTDKADLNNNTGRFNNIYYVMGVLLEALKLTQAENISLKEALFSIQYTKTKSMLNNSKAEINLVDCYEHVAREQTYYEAGLAYLKQYQPELDYLLPQNFKLKLLATNSNL